MSRSKNDLKKKQIPGIPYHWATLHYFQSKNAPELSLELRDSYSADDRQMVNDFKYYKWRYYHSIFDDWLSIIENAN